MKRGTSLSLVDGNTIFQLGDIVTAVCGRKTHEQLVGLFGELSEEALEHDRGELDYRRIECPTKISSDVRSKSSIFPAASAPPSRVCGAAMSISFLPERP
jgi:hypothetical protein